jgi:DNA-nicking Smr family endonuclease
MDFGDILDKWDRQTGKAPGTSRSPGKKAARMTAEQKTDILSAWLRINDVVDKDAELSGDAAPSGKGERRRRLRLKKPDAELDLHSKTRDEARLSLDGFFSLSRQQGREKLLIIHGKGNHSEGEAALKRVVQDYIERCPFAGESGQSAAAEGGSGATWVLLKHEGQGLDP